MNFLRKISVPGALSSARAPSSKRGSLITTNLTQPPKATPITNGAMLSKLNEGVLNSGGRSSSSLGLGVECLLTDVSMNNNGLHLRWADSTESTFHTGWLFRACSCPKCKQPFSGQVALDPQNFPVNPKPLSFCVEGSGQELSIKWDDSHVSKLTSQFLKRSRYDESSFEQTRSLSETTAITRDTGAPIISYKQMMADEEGLWKFISQLAEYGSVIVDGAPAQPGVVEGAGQRIGPVMQTIYGNTWNVRAEHRPINIAYSNASLSLHQDLAYYESPPAIQLLHCVRFDDSIDGGESVLMDLRAAAETLRSINPEAFHLLTQLPATFQKVHYDRENPVHIVYRRPHISVNYLGEIIAAFWAPAFEGNPMLPASQMQSYFDAYKAFADIIEDPNSPLRVSFRLKPGQIFAFNNRRMVHGRTEFSMPSGSVRHLEGCYISAEDFSSTLQKLGSKFSPSASTFRSLQIGNHL